MYTELNKYRITYRYMSARIDIGHPTRTCYVNANTFGEAERTFDMIFSHINDIADELYGDDAIYEIISIDMIKTNKEKA